MSNKSIAQKIIKSSFWQYIGSWLDKLIGFFGTIILARLLVPDDFGIVAASAIVTGLFHVIASVGTEEYLIRKSDLNDEDLNVGWTVNIVMKSITALLIFGTSWTVSEFMGDERLVRVLQVASISPFLAGFANIGMLLYNREYNFKPSVIVAFSNKLIGFITKISLAFLLNSYWAFMISEIVATVIYVAMTFVMHKYRPRLSFVGWQQQWSFSQWILLKSIFVFVRFRIDNILLSKFFPLETLGAYTVAKDIATMPSGQIIGPVMAPLYVGLSSVHEDAGLFANKVHKSLSVLFLIIFPIMLGTYITAENLVYVLLGDQWLHVFPLVEILAFILLSGALGNFLTKVITALGNVKLVFKFELILGFLTIFTFMLLAGHMNINEFALLRISLNVVNTLIVLISLHFISKISVFRVLGLMGLPFLVSVYMIYCINQIGILISTYSPIIQLTIQISFGAFIYFLVITGLVYLLRNLVDEYQFIWKTFYLSVATKLFGA